MSTSEDGQRAAHLAEFIRDRRLAHQVLFRHRHPLATPPFHHRIIDLFHSRYPRVVIEGFRDSAKSTVAEEAILLMANLKEFRNGVVVGSSYPRAKERLQAIKSEADNNAELEYLFGAQQGPTWGEGRIILANGVCLTALGSGMSMRGMRYLDARPDFALIDDLEDEETVRTPEARDAVMHWLYRTFIPAMARDSRIRFLGNRLDDDAVLVRISRDPAWRHIQIPIMSQAAPEDGGQERFDLPPGCWRPTWPEKFSLHDIAVKRAEYERLGLLHDFDCEYMCRADDPAAHVFTASQFRVSATIRTWEATYAAYDPARTATAKSAMTGVAVFSWIGHKLVVWRGDAQLWLPDRIIDDMFETDDRYGPVEMGVEATGLEEFIMQPLRHRALQRRQMLPLRRLVPPRGKDQFIRSLQPFFKAGEVEFVDVAENARAQLLSFPTGRKDFPNALAYALIMKPGQPVYEDFGRDHVVQSLLRTRDKWWLVVNADGHYTAAALAQLVGGQARIHRDWLREGSPGESLTDLAGEAQLEVGAALAVVFPPLPAGAHDVVGLRVAARACQLQPRQGGSILKGREALRRRLAGRRRGEPLFLVSAEARYTLNALAGGYAYATDKRGVLSSEPAQGPHRVLMEGLESFCAALDSLETGDEDARMAESSDGRLYRTASPHLAIPAARELKVP